MTLAPTSSRSGGSAAAGGATLICDTTLGGTQATIDTNTIIGGVIPATYKHLMFLLTARTNGGGATDSMLLQFNGDTGANYSYFAATFFWNAAVSSFGTEANSTTSIFFGTCPATTGAPGANNASSTQVTINGYAGTTFNKSVDSVNAYSTSNAASGNFIDRSTGNWRSTAAITRIVILLGGNSYIAGTRFSLFGLS